MNWNRKPPKKSHPLRLNKSLLNGVSFKQWTALQYNQRPRFSLDQIKTTTAVFFIFLTSSFFKPKSTDNKRPTADQINWTLERISQNFPYFSVPSFTFTTLTKKKKVLFKCETLRPAKGSHGMYTRKTVQQRESLLYTYIILAAFYSAYITSLALYFHCSNMFGLTQ